MWIDLAPLPGPVLAHRLPTMQITALHTVGPGHLLVHETEGFVEPSRIERGVRPIEEGLFRESRAACGHVFARRTVQRRNRSARETAQHRELPAMMDRVGEDRSE